MTGAAVSVNGVDVAFGSNRVLQSASISVAPGEVIGLLGASGSGKSTLLRVIAGIVRPDAGRVMIDDLDVTDRPTHLRKVGMVFQDNQLFSHRSVGDNVGFGLKMVGIGRTERERRTGEWLDLVGLGGFEQRRVTDLSGGEAKRVALARTLAIEPSVLLLDEPLTGLDRELHDQLVDELATLLRVNGATALLVTHDIAEATAIADRTMTLDQISGER